MTINLIGLSSGKDSTALWLWAIHESGYPKESIRGSFADTENEYDEVYEQIKVLDRHGQQNGIEAIRIIRNTCSWTWGQHPIFLALAMWKRRFPGAKSRFCTQLLKMFPCLFYVQEMQLNGWEVVSHSGVRRDESTERSIMEEWSEDGFLKCRLRRPILDWTIDNVWEIHRRHKVPINPLYYTGRTRVGCKLCVMSSKPDIRLTAKRRPEVIDEIRGWELIAGSKRNDGFSSFFPASNIPNRFHSRSYTNKKGQTFSAPTIDDVVNWAQTLRGGQEGFAFMFEEDDSHLPCQSGYCE